MLYTLSLQNVIYQLYFNKSGKIISDKIIIKKKPQSTQAMEYYSALKRNELSIHEKMWRKLKCILIERSQSAKAKHYDSSYMTFWQRQNLGRQLKDPCLPGLKGKEWDK